MVIKWNPNYLISNTPYSTIVGGVSCFWSHFFLIDLQLMLFFIIANIPPKTMRTILFQQKATLSLNYFASQAQRQQMREGERKEKR